MAKIDQPNLTCTYAVTISPGQDIRVLTVINKDPYGLSDNDMISALKTWLKDYKKYVDQKTESLDGQCNITVIPTKSPKSTTLNFIFFCEDEVSIPRFNDSRFYTVAERFIFGLEQSLKNIGENKNV
jgi:hypothetical protein